jgi:hypothetical protein
MLDLSHIPNSQQDVQVFYSNGVTNAWQTWQKPRKCNYVWIMCIGGGGGGGNGATPITSVNSGGGSGAVTRTLYNVQQLPDRLYVQVGTGGAAATAGTRSIVALQPAVVAQNIVVISGTAAALGGSTDGLGAARSGETAATQATATFFTLSNFISTAGQASPVYSTANVQPLTSQITSAGASGGWVSPPGNILSSSLSPFISGGINVSASGSNGDNGGNGITSWKPFFSTGGAGGGSSVSGSGGKGGDGGIGSGGGAGGSSNPPRTPGTGGKGGDGLVVIISF